MNVLVTGAAGFIGYHLAKLLRSNNFTVTALVRAGSDPSAPESLDIEIATGDIRAYVGEALSAWITRRQPPISLTAATMARKYMYFDCSKAVRELKILRNPVDTALEKAIEWYRKSGYVRNKKMENAHA